MSKLSSRGAEFQTIRLGVLDRDGWICTWPQCGKQLEGRDATVDHVTPVSVALSMGWTRAEIDAPTNLVAMCRKHNGQKRDQVTIRTDYLNPTWFERSPA